MTETLTHRQKMLTFFGILLAMFLGALDQTIVATALPRIVADLRGLSRFSWVATSYLVASTALVPIYGKLADMYSRRTVELGAIGVFLLGSMLCGLAGEFGPLPLLGDGMNQLIIFRAVQGLGGAGLFALAFIVIADLFAPVERGKYQGYVGAVFGLSSVLGPVLGGFLTDHGTNLIPGVAGWRLVFYVNAPFGLLALWFILKYMPPLRPAAEPQRFDYLSAALLMLGLGTLVVALQTDKARYGWTAPLTLGLLAAAGVALALFVARSLRHANPILHFGLFRGKLFRAANGAVFFVGGAFLSIVIFEPLFVVNVLGESATRAGVSLMPLSLGVVAGSIVAGQLVSRFGHYRYWMLGGLALLLLGMGLLAAMPATVGYYQLLGYLAVCGLGIGPSFPLFTLAVQNATEPRLIGQATAAVQFFRQIGGAVFTSILGAVLALSLATGLPAPGPGARSAPPLPEGPLDPNAPAPPPPPRVRQAFATAVKKVYFGSFFLVAAGLLLTFFIPEIPLRRPEEVEKPKAVA